MIVKSIEDAKKAYKVLLQAIDVLGDQEKLEFRIADNEKVRFCADETVWLVRDNDVYSIPLEQPVKQLFKYRKLWNAYYKNLKKEGWF